MDPEGLVCPECGEISYPEDGHCTDCGAVRPNNPGEEFVDYDPEVEQQSRTDQWGNKVGLGSHADAVADKRQQDLTAGVGDIDSSSPLPPLHRGPRLSAR